MNNKTNTTGTPSNGTMTVNNIENMELRDRNEYAQESISKAQLLIEEIYTEYCTAPEAEADKARGIILSKITDLLDLKNPGEQQAFDWIYNYKTIALKIDMIMDYLFKANKELTE
jgi:hypothetical protein